MKRNRLSIVAIFWVIACCAFAAAVRPVQAQTSGRHALLIGISQYDAYNKAGMFPNIDCARDVQQMAIVLKQKYGFKDSGIVVLATPEKTTRQAILAALQQIVAETNPGDLVYIHYSGHGSQVLDPDKPDGLDSTIVPADYQIDQSSEATSNEISGRTIASELKSLQERKPAQVVLSFDCCHSGDISRGAAKKRGLTYAEYSAWFQAAYHRLPPQPKPGPAAHGAGGAALQDLDDKGYVVLSACSNGELAAETDDADPPMGRLTKCLVHVLASANKETTYRQVFDEINAVFEAQYGDQHPQLAGDPDTYLLGGDAPALVDTVPVHLGGETGFVLDAGALQDVTTGSTYTLYRKDAATFDDASKIADATVSGIAPTSAELTVTPTPADPNSLSGAQAIEKTHNYSLSALKFDPASVQAAAPDQAPAILAKLKTLSMVATDYPSGLTPDVKMLTQPGDPKTRGAATIWLARCDTGYSFKQLDSTKDLPSQVSADLDREARYRYVLGMIPPASIRTGAVGVDLRLVPAQSLKDQYGDQVWAPDDTGKSVPSQVGDLFMLEVRNTGKDKEHVTVLDLDSDGKVEVRWPEKGAGPDDNLVNPGQAWIPLWLPNQIAVPAVYKFDSPDPGGEIYKAIATDTPVDFSSLSRGERGPSTPFDALIAPGLTGTRGSAQVSAPTVWDAAQIRVVVTPAPLPSL